MYMHWLSLAFRNCGSRTISKSRVIALLCDPRVHRATAGWFQVSLGRIAKPDLVLKGKGLRRGKISSETFSHFVTHVHTHSPIHT